jgi:D-glycero-alpha-D-manno-heptose 1-phosphate guanylyltransferase
MNECIILAGGFGTRLQNVVGEYPKCLAPVNGQPFLSYLFRYLEHQEINRIILSLGYKHELVEEWANAFPSPFGISFAVEDEPLGTGGGIKLALKQAAGDHVTVVNGDTLFAADIPRLINAHLAGKHQVTLALKPMQNFDRYGCVQLENSTVRQFEEKQPKAAGLINGGVFVIGKNTLDGYPDKFSFEKDYLERNVGTGIIGGLTDNGYFIDIGIPDDYKRAQWEIPEKF